MASIERRKIGPLRRQYRRFLDWLWFGPLTRDVRWRYPTYYPSRFKVACSLPADLCRFIWSRLRPDSERSRRPGT
jgi:hypothetical protein